MAEVYTFDREGVTFLALKFTRDFGGYNVGELTARPEAEATKIVKEFKAGVFVTEKGEAIDTPVVEEAPAAPAAPDNPNGEIEIPADWEASHHLARISLAKKLNGDTAPANADEANAIIKAELARRAGS